MSNLPETEKVPSGCCFHAERPEPFALTEGCQFERERIFSEVDGKDYCRFHMPMVDSAGQPTAKSGETLFTHSDFQSDIHKILEVAVRAPLNIADLTGVQFPVRFDFTDWAKKRSNKLGGSIGDEPPIGGYPFPRICAFRANFADQSSFRELSIPHNSSFCEAIFGNGTMFSGAQFDTEVDFTQALFGYDTNFSYAKFGGGVSFGHAVFGGEANFEHALFERYALFLGAAFGDEATFRDATFFETGIFNNVTFEGGIDFSASDKDSKYSRIDFNRVTFASRWPNHWKAAPWEEDAPTVSFTNRIFSDKADFRGAVFHVAPDFHDAKLHQSCTISEANFKDVELREAPAAYRTLKLAMEQKRDWNAMAKFYALEQRSIRHQPETSQQVKLMSFAYEVASDYGQSFVRPLAGIGLTIIFAFGLYWIYYLFDGGSWKVSAFENIAVFDLRQMIKPFDAILVNKWPYELRGPMSFVIGIIATLQTIASAGFVTLFILAVRRRFRMA